MDYSYTSETSCEIMFRDTTTGKIPIFRLNLLQTGAIMSTTGIREKLHQYIDTIGDKKAAAIYALFEDDIDTDANRKRLILAEREKYLRGEGRSYSIDEVKDMALNKEKRHAI
jgi:hypothetical protein